MDTRSGEIFRRDNSGNLLPDGYDSDRERLEALERMRDAERRGELADVSEQVARQQQLGQQATTRELDTQIIADQERRIARLRAELRIAQQFDSDLEELIVERFNPPDDDSSTPYTVIESVASFIEALPCGCTAEQIEDWDGCARCRVLGRIGDKPVVR